MLTLTVAAGVSGGVLRGGAPVGCIFFNTMPAVSPTSARMGSVSVMVAPVFGLKTEPNAFLTLAVVARKHVAFLGHKNKWVQAVPRR